MSTWIDKHYRSLMLGAMVAELALLVALVVMDYLALHK